MSRESRETVRERAVERRLRVGITCSCGWGMYQTTYDTLLCQNSNCEYANVEYELPLVTLRQYVSESRRKGETQKWVRR